MQTTLFLGLPVSPALSDALAKVNPALLSLFTQGGEDYLEFYEIRGQRYLGKALGDWAEVSKIELVQANVLSLLRRLIPDFPLNDHDLQIIT